MNLVPLSSVNSRILQEIRYATPDNFLRKILYSKPIAYLQKPTADRLHHVQLRLERQRLGLKVWDAYRPLSVQKIFWNHLPDPRYVADPAIGSKHNRGAAVDATLVDHLGRELPMPTGFDSFSPAAHRDYQDGEPTLLHHRETLKKAMASEGFIPLLTEWWHFDDPDWEQFPVLDVPFEDLP